MGLRSSLCKFSINAISATALSLLSSTIVGISDSPASLEALKRLSPAIIWYLPSAYSRTSIGCKSPFSLIEYDN